MRILVTGGSGYVGSVLVPHLMREGHHVTVVDTRHPVNDHEYVEGDARDMRVVQPLLRRADVVIPLAGIVGAPACKSKESLALTTNSYAIHKLIANMMSNDQRIIFPATDSGYPSGDVNEMSPMEPVSIYARTKKHAEDMVLSEGHVSLRLASVFGVSPRMRTDLIVNNFVLHAVNRKLLEVYEPDFWRNFVHVRDVARAFSHAALHIAPGAYNVGDPRACMTKLDLCKLIDRSLPWFEYVFAKGTTDPDRRNSRVSTAKFEATGWEPRYGLNYGIAELIEGYAHAIA